MYFDRYDVCEAYYLWLQHNWAGQGCPHYVRFCRLQTLFTPGYGPESLIDLTANGRAIYDNIGKVG